ncbi:otoraplin-like isoform X1 [Poeciliopsis prolifica]|uniref:otoraplin-like isoform X1 n=1 Tax=Poeciliopsis prolifica TaxID=188132 RepID=UPI002412E7AE|nr:otoraplin-like isoform X1 [Poeciliopsis prolifica]
MSRPLVRLLLVGLLHQTTMAVQMDKLADRKMCGDAECSYVLSMATAVDDFMAPDCRFINIKMGQMVYVYSKLIPPDGAGVFWYGSNGIFSCNCGERDQDIYRQHSLETNH